MRSRARPGGPRRSLRLAAMSGLALALLMAPSALAAGPVTTVFHPTAPILYPAGSGCAFDVQAQPEHATVVTTTFSNGASVTTVVADPILTNLSTGDSLVWHARVTDVETYDAATNSVTDVTVGQFNEMLGPGDQGPHGVVAWPGLFVSVVGEVTERSDADTGAVTRFSLHGVVIGNICTELSV